MPRSSNANVQELKKAVAEAEAEIEEKAESLVRLERCLRLKIEENEILRKRLDLFIRA